VGLSLYGEILVSHLTFLCHNHVANLMLQKEKKLNVSNVLSS
jgi:hypothetical protein